MSLSGGLLMLSDVAALYEGERLQCIRKTIPAQPVVTAETGPLEAEIPAYPTIPPAQTTAGNLALDDALKVTGRDPAIMRAHPFSSLWSIHYRRAGRRWCVIGRFAIVPLAETTVELDALGLDPQTRHHAFDFWAGRYLGSCRAALACSAVPLGSCQIIGLAPCLDRPAYLADSRHISFGLGFVEREGWDGRRLLLDLIGIEGVTFSLWISIPPNVDLMSAAGEGLAVVARRDDPCAGVVEIHVGFGRARARLALGFSPVQV
jgi:hypothetical protein